MQWTKWSRCLRGFYQVTYEHSKAALHVISRWWGDRRLRFPQLQKLFDNMIEFLIFRVTSVISSTELVIWPSTPSKGSSPDISSSGQALRMCAPI